MFRKVIAIAGFLPVAACVPAEPEDLSGKDLYGRYCATCHGEGGRGDGPVAGDLPKVPADLTGIAARNGGEFPLIAVMSKIDGYTKGDDAAMPELGVTLSEGEMVLTDLGDGVETPTPARLLALAEYLKTIQR
jgi:mono/diheme cytochrome c family protein